MKTVRDLEEEGWNFSELMMDGVLGFEHMAHQPGIGDGIGHDRFSQL